MRQKFSKIFLGLAFLIALTDISCKSTENPKGLGEYAGVYSATITDASGSQPYTISIGTDGSANVNGTQGTVNKISDTEYEISFNGHVLKITFVGGNVEVQVDGGQSTLATKIGDGQQNDIGRYAGTWDFRDVELVGEPNPTISQYAGLYIFKVLHAYLYIRADGSIFLGWYGDSSTGFYFNPQKISETEYQATVDGKTLTITFDGGVKAQYDNQSTDVSRYEDIHEDSYTVDATFIINPDGSIDLRGEILFFTAKNGNDYTYRKFYYDEERAGIVELIITFDSETSGRMKIYEGDYPPIQEDYDKCIITKIN